MLVSTIVYSGILLKWHKGRVRCFYFGRNLPCSTYPYKFTLVDLSDSFEEIHLQVTVHRINMWSNFFVTALHLHLIDSSVCPVAQDVKYVHLYHNMIHGLGSAVVLC